MGDFETASTLIQGKNAIYPVHRVVLAKNFLDSDVPVPPDIKRTPSKPDTGNTDIFIFLL